MASKPTLPGVPFLNLSKLYADHKEEFDSVVQSVCGRAAFIRGPEVEAFEKAFASWCGTGLSTVGCANGTDAITLAAHAFQLSQDAEAIAPAMTFVATVAGLKHAGLKVKLVDVDPQTYVMDVKKLEQAITAKTRVIVPVHLYGQMAPMDKIREIADKHGLFILEDSAQAHGARWNGHGPGYWGDLATFSFFPGKNLGAFGDAGAVVGKKAELLNLAKAYASQGGLQKYVHDYVGYNSRLDTVQAAVLQIKLKYIDQWNARRREVAKAYFESLANVEGLQLPTIHPNATSAFHLFVVQVPDRTKFMGYLKENGVETGIHYPSAIHQNRAYQAEYAGQKFPNAEKLAAQGVSLPMCPMMTDAHIQRVVEVVTSFFVGAKKRDLRVA